MSAEDTRKPEFYAPWPDLGKKFQQQLNEIRTDTSYLFPIVRTVGLDTDGDFTTLNGVEKAAVQSHMLGKQDFHNKFRTHYNKDKDLFELAYNNGTPAEPNWYTTWWMTRDGHVTQQNTPTTATNVGFGEGWFKEKDGVDLKFKTITATSPITIVNDGDSIDVDGSALVSTYSGGGGDVDIIRTKVGNDLPFKGLEAGVSTVLTDNGDYIRIDSTAQVVEFYGISINHDDGSTNYNEVHNLLVNRANFYLTQQKSNPSNKTVILNSISDPFVSTDYVAVIGDDMIGPLAQADGSEGAPSFTFTDDTTMGLSRNAADDLAVSIAGAHHTRFLSDRLLIEQGLQVTNSGNAAAPDIYFFPDSDTGLYQDNADELAFATGGQRAGYFDSDHNFFVQNNIQASNVEAGEGVFYTQAIADKFLARGQNRSGLAMFSFEDYPGTGIHNSGGDSLYFMTAGTSRLYFGTTGAITATLPLEETDGTPANPAYGFSSQSGAGAGIGMYKDGTDELSFATAGVRALWIYKDGETGATDQDVHIPKVLRAAAGGVSNPSYSFSSAANVGMYQEDGGEGLAFATSSGLGLSLFSSSPSGSEYAQFSGSFVIMPNGTLNSPGVVFSGGGGIYRYSTNQLGFSSVSAYAGHFDSNQDLHIKDHIFAAAGAFGDPTYSFEGQATTGMYFHSTSSGLGFSTGGTLAGYFNSGQSLVVINNVYSGFGTEALPSLSFRHDSDTGLFQLTDGNDGTIAFTSQGSEAGYFDASLDLYVTNDIIAGGDVETTDEAYGGSWDGSDNVPTKNAVYDKIQSMRPHVTFKESEVGGYATVSDSVAFDSSRFYVSTGGDGSPLVALNESVYTLDNHQGLHNLSKLNSGGLGIDESMGMSVGAGSGLVHFYVSNSGPGKDNRDTMLIDFGGVNYEFTPPDPFELTAGTDNSPGLRYLWLQLDGGVPTLTEGTSDWPTDTPHARLATTVIQSATEVELHGALKLQAWTDHPSEPTGAGDGTRGDRGHLHSLAERLRMEPAVWTGGMSLTSPVVDSTNPIYVETTVGTGYQMHKHIIPAFNSDPGEDNDPIFVVNAGDSDTGDDGTTGKYMAVRELNDITRYSTDVVIGNQDAYTLIVWASINENQENSHLFVNVPSDGYGTVAGALSDSGGYRNYQIPQAYLGTAIYLCEFVIKRSGGGSVYTVTDTKDLRGTPGTSIGGTGTSSAGEANTASNSGAGEGLALTKVGIDLPFKSLLPFNETIDITSDADEVFIEATGLFPDDIRVINDVKAGRVEAGIGHFYSHIIVDTQVSPTNKQFSTPTGETGILFDDANNKITFTVNTTTHMSADFNRLTLKQSRFSNSLLASPACDSFWDPNTGLHWEKSVADNLYLVTGGVAAAWADENQNFHVLNDVKAGRVEAGTGNFYTQLDIAHINFTATNGVPGVIPHTKAFEYAETAGLGMYFSGTTMMFTANNGSARLRVGPNDIRAYAPWKNIDATAATPSYSFASDPETGMYLPADNQLGFTTAGQYAGHFDSDQSLHVENDVKAGRVEAGTGWFYTSLTVGDERADDSIIEFYDEASLAYTMGFDESATAFKLASGVFDDTNDMLRVTEGEFDFRGNELKAGRIEAGTGVFYTQVNADRFIADRIGTAAECAFAFGPDGGDTGMYQNSAGRIDFAVNKTFVFNLTNSRVYTAKPIHMRGINTDPAAVDIGFLNDVGTGLYQLADGGGTLAFASDGQYAGHFDADQSLHVENDVKAGRVEAGTGNFYTSLTTDKIRLSRSGTKSDVAIGWEGDDDTGLFHPSSNIMDFATNDNVRMRIGSGAIGLWLDLQLDDDTTAAAPALNFRDDADTGIYQLVNGGNDLAFSTGGKYAGYFDSDQSLHVENDLKAGRVEAGHGNFYIDATAGRYFAGPTVGEHLSKPQYSFANDTDTGMSMNDTTTGLYFNVSSTWKMFMSTSAVQLNTKLLIDDDATAGAPALQFRDDQDTGLYQLVNAGNDLAFSTGGQHAGHFDSGQSLHVTNDIFGENDLHVANELDAQIGFFYQSLHIGGHTPGGDADNNEMWKISTSFTDLLGSELNITPTVQSSWNGASDGPITNIHSTLTVLDGMLAFDPPDAETLRIIDMIPSGFSIGTYPRQYTGLGLRGNQTLNTNIPFGSMVASQGVITQTTTGAGISFFQLFLANNQFYNSTPEGWVPSTQSFMASNTFSNTDGYANTLTTFSALINAGVHIWPIFQAVGDGGSMIVNESEGYMSTLSMRTEHANATLTVTLYNDFHARASSEALATGTLNFTTRNMLELEDDVLPDNLNGIHSVITSGANKKFINHTGTAVSEFGGAITAPVFNLTSPEAYTTSNVNVDRSFDADGGDINVVSDVLATLIEDLKTAGILT